MTRTCSLEWSCTTLAITDACACRIEPGGSVAKPTVCALAALANRASAIPRDFSISISSLLGRQYISRMQPKERVPYSPTVDRPPLKLPGGARVAVWTIVNVEEWAIERPMPRTVLPPPYGQPLLPDLPNWAWHEYGMRVGFWRFVDAL